MTTEVTIPTSATELEEMLADPVRMQATLKDPAAFSTFIKNYAATVRERDAGIAEQVRNQVQATLTEMLKDEAPTHLSRLPQAGNATTLGSGRNAPGTRIDNVFENSGEFFKTVWHQADVTGPVAENRQKLRNALSSVVPGDGGFLVPETLRSELLRLSLESSIVRPRARVIPMESARVPFPTVDSTSNASSVYGGIVAYWTAEGAAAQESQPSFGRVVLDASKLVVYTEVPNELLADSAVAMEAFMGQVFPEALSFYEDDAFLNGNGVGQPLGVLNAAAAVSVAKQSGQAADTIVWENIVKMYARMLPSSLGRAVWVAHINTFPELATMALSVGTGGSAVWLNNGVEGPPMTILGRPVIFTEKAETLGDSGDINFIDFGHYLIGDRQTMSAESSPHYKFSSDVTAFKVTERVDGRPWVQSAITPKTGSDTLSPYVKLAARA